jgi:uncharacterized DUF497 family protein
MEWNLNFGFDDFDFSDLEDWDLREMGDVTFEEIIEVFFNRRTMMRHQHEWPWSDVRFSCIGFSSKARCLFMTLDYSKARCRVSSVKLASEREIDDLWCKRNLPTEQ